MRLGDISFRRHIYSVYQLVIFIPASGSPRYTRYNAIRPRRKRLAPGNLPVLLGD